MPTLPTLKNSPMPSRATAMPAELPNADETFGEDRLPTADEAFGNDQIDPGRISHIVDAFGLGSRQGFGSEPIATPATSLSPETMDALKRHGLMNDYTKGEHDLRKTLYEGIITQSAAAFELAQRSANAAIGGFIGAGEQVAKEIGLAPKDAPIDADAALGDPGVIMLLGPMEGEAAAFAARTRARDLTTIMSEARSRGVIGEGEGGFYDAKPLTPEHAQARVEAAHEIGIPPPPDIMPPPADIHELARRIEPETFARFDGLAAQQEEARRAIADIGTPDEPVTLPVIDEGEIRLHSREAQISADMDALRQQVANTEKPNPEAFAAQERLNRLDAVESDLRNPDLTPDARKTLRTRRDEILTDTTPEALRAAAAPIATLRTLTNQGAALARERQAVREELANLHLGRTVEEAKAPEYPLELERARRRLQEVDAGLRELMPGVVSAYRRASEILGPEKMAEQAAAAVKKSEPVAPAKPVGTIHDAHEEMANATAPEHAAETASQVRHDVEQITEAKAPELSDEVEGRGRTGGVAAPDEGVPGGANAAGPLAGEAGSAEGAGAKPAGGNEAPREGAQTQPQPASNGQPEPDAGRTGTNQRAVSGTGQTRTRGLSEGIEAKAIEEGLTQGFGDLPEYKQVSMADQAERAAELLATDPEAAKAIAMGQKAPPRGLLPESVFVAVEKAALATGDVETLRALATESKLTSAATTMGQRIRTLRERDPASPIGAIEEVQKARARALEKRSGAKAQTEGAVAEIRNEIRKTASASKQDWAEFVKKITCAT